MKALRVALVALLLVAGPTLLAACSDDDDSGSGGETGAEEEVDVEATVGEIERLLDEMLETYEAGDAEAAGELAAEAYLENYEHLEHSVEEADEELNEELEALLGTQMREEIRAGADPEELTDLVDEAKALLDEAVDAVEAA